MKKLIQRDANVYGPLENDLRTRILMGTVDFSKPILGEIEFSKVYGVSRESVRKAISKLAGDGLLVRVKGKGTYIIPPGRRSPTQKLNPNKFSIIVIEPLINRDFTDYRDSFLESVTVYCGRNNIQMKCADADIDCSSVLKAYKDGEINGVIWDMPDEKHRAAIHSFAENHIPVVTTNRHVDGIPCVCPDFQTEIIDSVSLLKDLGHSDIALLNSASNEMPYLEREKAYFNIINSGKFYVKINLDCDLSGDIARLLQENPSALIVGGHALIKKTLDVIRSLKLRLREDISVICVNDCPAAYDNTPPVTVFAENRVKAGIKCAELLRETAHNPAIQTGTFKIKGDLIWRQSCGPALSPLKKRSSNF